MSRSRILFIYAYGIGTCDVHCKDLFFGSIKRLSDFIEIVLRAVFISLDAGRFDGCRIGIRHGNIDIIAAVEAFLSCRIRFFCNNVFRNYRWFIVMRMILIRKLVKNSFVLSIRSGQCAFHGNNISKSIIGIT